MFMVAVANRLILSRRARGFTKNPVVRHPVIWVGNRHTDDVVPRPVFQQRRRQGDIPVSVSRSWFKHNWAERDGRTLHVDTVSRQFALPDPVNPAST